MQRTRFPRSTWVLTNTVTIYGGIEGDQRANTFKKVKTNSSFIVTNFDYQIKWQDKDPFPLDDPRVHQTGEYEVRLALVDAHGRRLVLGVYTMEVSQHGYTLPFVFGPEHIGRWRIKLEFVSDPNQFVWSDWITIQYKDATTYYLGQEILPPTGAAPDQKPEMDNEDAAYWSVDSNRLFAIAPITTVINWFADTDRTIPIPIVAYITYPETPQHHVADSLPVDLLPEGTAFDLVEKKYADNDAAINANQFAASREGWTVLLYRDNQAAEAIEKEKLEVVRTLAWDHSGVPETNEPKYPVESTATIGEPINDIEFHDDQCGSGYAFFENAHYDGYGETRAYDRATRQGTIFAVNEDVTGPIENELSDAPDDLVLVWYEQSAISGVCWPYLPVRYETEWPDDAPKIVIASRQGTGPLDPTSFGSLETMLIYNQPDKGLPGYNPNEEHAAFFTALGSEQPAVFALRTDLNKAETSQPYVLLKYMDPLSNEWNFKVFEVVVQSRPFTVQTGQVVPANLTPDERYFIDATGALALRDGALPGASYYLDERGLLVNSGDTQQAWYNLTSGLIQPVLPNEVKIFYIDESALLIEQGLLSDRTGPPPLPSYYLDEHGIIVANDTYYRLHYTGTAGQEINPPYPLNQLTFGPCEESYTGTPELVLNDKDNKFFAKAGGINGQPAAEVILNYYYRLQPGFFYDLDGNGSPDKTVGTCIPWLEGLDGSFDGETPVDTDYAIRWPDPVPSLFVGETLTDAKTQEGEAVGLPNVADQCIARVLFDQSLEEGGGPMANLIDPITEFSVDYALTNPEGDLPQNLKPGFSLNAQRWIFTALPYHLQTRLTYDPAAGDGGQLKLKGIYSTGTGEPLLLLNFLTERDRAVIALVDDQPTDPAFMAKVDNLISQAEAGLEYPAEGYPELQFAEMKALTAGDALGTGYMTLEFNNHEDCTAPTVLNVIKVNCPLYRGEIKVIESVNPFEEKLTLRHNGDFGGNSDERWFQWKYLPADFSGIPNGPKEPSEDWKDYFAVLPVPETAPDSKDPADNGQFYQGALDVTVQGTGQQLLPDKWFAVRYFYDDNETDPNDICPALSAWTRPQLYEGWVKRVSKRINTFDQKVKDFHESDVNTLASMISLAGRRYEGDIALSDDPEYLQNLGIIEVYETLLNRGKGLTGDGEDYADINKALLFAANRLADLYMLLGNEAFSDAADPTIGFSTEDGRIGTEAAAIFSFENQVGTLLDEELALLRGRDGNGVQPFYNRLIWNFTLGDGEVAYKENYNISDQNQDGEINEHDAMIQYPQGHGDAWGYYLSAVKKYYELLKMENFTWLPQTEAILVDQTPVEVDYRDERKFAAAAAARARAGAELVGLTYRQNYIEDPESQWQGYKDIDPARAWGVSGWSRRTGQAALFDWIVGNAILPPEKEEEQTASEGQTVFTLEFIDYEPGTKSLRVFVNEIE